MVPPARLACLGGPASWWGGASTLPLGRRKGHTRGSADCVTLRLGDGTGVFTHTLPNPLNSHFTVYTYFLEQKSLCALQPTQGRSRWPRPGGTPTWSCCPRQLLTQAMWSLSEQQGQRAVQGAGCRPGAGAAAAPPSGERPAALSRAWPALPRGTWRGGARALPVPVRSQRVRKP